MVWRSRRPDEFWMCAPCTSRTVTYDGLQRAVGGAGAVVQLVSADPPMFEEVATGSARLVVFPSVLRRANQVVSEEDREVRRLDRERDRRWEIETGSGPTWCCW